MKLLFFSFLLHLLFHKDLSCQVVISTSDSDSRFCWESGEQLTGHELNNLPGFLFTVVFACGERDGCGCYPAITIDIDVFRGPLFVKSLSIYFLWLLVSIFHNKIPRFLFIMHMLIMLSRQPTRQPTNQPFTTIGRRFNCLFTIMGRKSPAIWFLSSIVVYSRTKENSLWIFLSGGWC